MKPLVRIYRQQPARQASNIDDYNTPVERERAQPPGGAAGDQAQPAGQLPDLPLGLAPSAPRASSTPAILKGECVFDGDPDGKLEGAVEVISVKITAVKFCLAHLDPARSACLFSIIV